MYCKNCGAEISDGEVCSNCGSRQVETVPVNATPEAPADWKRVNKLVYGILGILLGSLGIHKFYAGKVMWGIIYILLFWTCIPGILGLVEGILALLKESGPDNMVAVDPNKFML